MFNIYKESVKTLEEMGYTGDDHMNAKRGVILGLGLVTAAGGALAYTGFRALKGTIKMALR